VTARNGRTVYVHERECLRFWEKESDGKLQPGKGFTSEVRRLPRLTAAFDKAEAKARELGLITSGGDGGDQ